MNRRDFLRDGLLATASLVLSSKISLAQVSSKPQKILIIGAGLSGLVAAYELNKLGHDITILEAQQRGGGRVLTVRDFPEKLYAEAGAARVFHTHDLTHRYIREFNLPLADFYPTSKRFMRLDNGKAEKVGWGKFTAVTDVVMVLEKPKYWQKIKGGNDQLPRAFAEKLGGKIRYNSPVVKIEQNGKEIIVKFGEKGKLETISGDFVICAIPLTVLKNIEVEPKFSDAKTKIILETVYDSASRIFLQTKDRFWFQKKLNGFGFGENFTEIWDSTFGQAGTRGILQSYYRGLHSEALTKISEAQRIETTVKSLEKLFPALRASFEKGFSKCWSEDAWVKGAWAHLAPEQKAILMQPENRVFFAGEHISDFPSWMQGALQSGLRVVREISNSKISQKT